MRPYHGIRPHCAALLLQLTLSWRRGKWAETPFSPGCPTRSISRFLENHRARKVRYAMYSRPSIPSIRTQTSPPLPRETNFAVSIVDLSWYFARVFIEEF